MQTLEKIRLTLESVRLFVGSAAGWSLLSLSSIILGGQSIHLQNPDTLSKLASIRDRAEISLKVGGNLSVT
jgi:hypothetical protein